MRTTSAPEFTVNWPGAVLGIVTSVWYAGLLTNSFKSTLRAGSCAWLPKSCDDDLVKWTLVVGALATLVAVVTAVPRIFNDIASLQQALRRRQLTKTTLMRGLSVQLLIFLTFATYVIVPVLAGMLKDITLQEVVMTIGTLSLIFVLRTAEFAAALRKP